MTLANPERKRGNGSRAILFTIPDLNVAISFYAEMADSEIINHLMSGLRQGGRI